MGSRGRSPRHLPGDGRPGSGNGRWGGDSKGLKAKRGEMGEIPNSGRSRTSVAALFQQARPGTRHRRHPGMLARGCLPGVACPGPRGGGFRGVRFLRALTRGTDADAGIVTRGWNWREQTGNSPGTNTRRQQHTYPGMARDPPLPPENPRRQSRPAPLARPSPVLPGDEAPGHASLPPASPGAAPRPSLGSTPRGDPPPQPPVTAPDRAHGPCLLRGSRSERGAVMWYRPGLMPNTRPPGQPVE